MHAERRTESSSRGPGGDKVVCGSHSVENIAIQLVQEEVKQTEPWHMNRRTMGRVERT